MPGLQPTVLIMFYEVVVRIAGEGQRVKPQSINWRVGQSRKLGRGRCQMRQIMTQDVMPNNVVERVAKPLQTLEDRGAHPFLYDAWPSFLPCDCRI